MARQQHAQLFKALADGGNGLRQMQVALRGTAAGLGVGGCIGCVHAATGEHVGTRRETGGHGAARHQDFNAPAGQIGAFGGAVAQQQHGGRRAGGNGVALGVQELVESWHGVNFATKVAKHVSRVQ